MVHIKNIIKKTFLLSFILISIIAFNIHANDIESIDIEAVLNDDGSANITETWSTNNTDGTEWYIPKQNLNHMKLKNFSVRDEQGNEYQFVDDWDVDASFEEKRHKCGINHTSDGIELCFGKSDMGNKKYILTYVYENFVQNFDDMDGFNVRFINDKMSPAPKNVSVKISTNTELNKDNAKIWAFGYGGEIVFKDGYVYANNTFSFYSNHHVTILMGIQKGILHPTYKGKGNFSDLRDKALVGSDYTSNEENSGVSSTSGGIVNKKSNRRSFGSIIGRLFQYLIPIIIGLQVVFVALLEGNKKPKNFKKINRKTPQYYRDNITDGYLPAIYYLTAIQMNKDASSDLIAAYFLKWIKDKSARPLDDEYKETEGGFLGLGKKHSKLNIYLDDLKNCESEGERSLYNMFKTAAGEDSILVYNEVNRYFKKNYSKFPKITEAIRKEGEAYLIKNGYLYKEKKFVFTKSYFTESGIQEVKNLYAMRRFLKKFTLISERTPKEVALWDFYLIIATMMGIGEEVMKSFGELYPDYKYGGYYSPSTVYYLSHQTGRRSYNSYSSQVRSSGGGGSSSFGGGGGFSGGGSGGGSR